MILFRVLDPDGKEELDAIPKDVTTSRVTLEPSWSWKDPTLVVGRYANLPFYRELERDVQNLGLRLINSWDQHDYIANLPRWYQDLKDYTPRTFVNSGYGNVPETEHGYIVKGTTNSRKFEWSESMYARDRLELRRVYNRLMMDSMIRDQQLVIREYVPLEPVLIEEGGRMVPEEGLHNLPITQEYRFFCLGTEIVAHGYYWAISERCEEFTAPPEAIDLVKEVMPIIARHTNFYVVDVALTQTGDWTIIELNDGQQSGLSMIDPHSFYERLLSMLAEFEP